MKNKIKSFLGKLHKSVAAKMMALSMVVAVTLVPACAAEGETPAVAVDMTAITSAFSSGINTVITTSIQLISLMLPAVLGFFAVKFVAIKGMSWFKSMASK